MKVIQLITLMWTGFDEILFHRHNVGNLSQIHVKPHRTNLKDTGFIHPQIFFDFIVRNQEFSEIQIKPSCID